MEVVTVTADRGSIAAGRDVNLHCKVRPCGICERRLVMDEERACNHCVARLRADRVRQEFSVLVLVFLFALAPGLSLAQRVDWPNPWAFAIGVAFVLTWASYRIYAIVVAFAECDLPRLWRRLRNR